MMQLPSELANEVDTQRPHRRRADRDLLAGEPGEGLARQVGIGEILEHIARSGPGHHQNPILLCDLVELDRSVSWMVLGKIVPIVPFECAGTDEVEPIRRLPEQGELGAHAAVARKQMSQSDATDPRETIGEETVEPELGSPAGDLVFRKRRHVLQTDAVMNRATLLADELEVVRAAK